jgi:DNA polymerase III subunit alpha
MQPGAVLQRCLCKKAVKHDHASSKRFRQPADQSRQPGEMLHCPRFLFGMNDSYIHLQTHSYYSLLEGLLSPTELVQAAASSGQPAIALTDRQSLAGAVPFVLACRQAGIQPILGVEIPVELSGQSFPLTLLAEAPESWRSLCRLVSRLNLREVPEAACSLTLLASCSEGLLALCPPSAAALGFPLDQLLEIFSQRLYALITHPVANQLSLEAAHRRGIPAAASAPVFFQTPEQVELQRLVSAIRSNSTLAGLPPDAPAPRTAYFAGPTEMQLRFRDLPQALAVTREIAARCQGTLPLGKPQFPLVPLPDGMTAAQVLRQKAEQGARWRYGQISLEIQQRLDRELEVITARGFEPIFLIVEEILNYARSIGVPTSSRGSAASSLVAYCLGITVPDPLLHDLYFERFLNPARSLPPDIDTDICSRGRDRVIQHVFDTYSSGTVSMVGTINRFRPRSALGDAAKAHGLPIERIRALTSSLPHAFFARQEEESQEGLPSPFDDLRAANPAYRRIFTDAEALLRLPRHFSVHAGGLIIGPGPLEGYMPLMRSGSKGITITQMDLESVEALGLVKIDLLGIRGLTVLGDVAARLYSWRSRDFSGPLEVLDAISMDDAETAAKVEKGETIGCFQIESPGMRATLKEIRARSVEDIIAALALYRPGPLQGGLKDAFVRRFKGEEPVQHLHPALEPLLGSTYGVILYQEQVLRIAHDLAGLSLADADLLRRAMSHFDPGREMQNLKERFIHGAAEKCDIPAATGERLWELMAAFAGYGFPKAHAASYAQIAWRAAWCKTHFPAEFMAAVLANWGGYYPQRVYLSEVRRLGLRIRPPHVNHSQREFCTVYPDGQPVLYMGLDQIRDLTRRTIDRMLRLRPFSSFDDFLVRVDPRRQEAENLVRVGGFEGMGSPAALLYRLQGGWKAGQLSLFEFEGGGQEEWGMEELAAAQQDLLGVSLNIHPLELHAAALETAGAISTLEAAGRIGQRVRVAGVRQSGHRSRTAKGESMMFLTLEDLDGTLDMVFFPDAYRRARGVLAGSAPILVTGVVELDERRGELLLRAERADLLR